MSEEAALPMWKCWRIFDCCISAAHIQLANKHGWITVKLSSFEEDFGLTRSICNQLLNDKVKFIQLEHTCVLNVLI